MNNKLLLYKKINALRLEVDSSIVDDILSTVDDLYTEHQNTNSKLEELEKIVLALKKGAKEEIQSQNSSDMVTYFTGISVGLDMALSEIKSLKEQ